MLPILLTSRLRLRPPRLSDLEGIYALGRNPRVMQYITPGSVQSRSEARADLQKRMAISQEGPYGYWVIEMRETAAFVGWATLKPLDQTEEIEVGYRLLEEYWGQGLATEAARALLDYGFQELGLTTVYGVTMPQNEASRRVLAKLGMRLQGLGTFYEVECTCYRLERTEWQAPKALPKSK
ncbi:MAG: GNAT family N-acetyltransferase [Lewinella sp.]|nr:GNAT family N-acetyltransferase [Lewinella sp.]